MCDTTTRVTAGRASGRVGPRPRWGILYGFAGGTVVWLGATELLLAPGPARTALRVGLTLATIAVLSLWIRLNGVALDQEEWCECAAERMTVRVIESGRRVPVAIPFTPSVLLAIDAENEYELVGR